MSGYGFQDYDITAEKILKKRSDMILWKYYLGCDYELGKSIKAPYREDNNPSFSLTYCARSGKILGRDFGKGGFWGDVFDYVKMKYSLDYYSALVRVNLDFDMGLSYSPSRYRSISHTRVSPKELSSLEKFEIKINEPSATIEYEARHSDAIDKAYWEQYGIPLKTLFKYNVNVADAIIKNNKTNPCYYTFRDYDRCYVYRFPPTAYRARACIKCYWPSRKNYRFMGNANNDYDIQGYDQCRIAHHEHSDLLVLTKSMKDCMVFHEFGIQAMAAHGESHKFNADFIRHLKKYYKRIVSLYDKDVTGIKGAKYLWKDHGIEPYFINKRYKCKDISDMFKAHGREVTKQFINQIEYEQKNHGDIHPEK